jgi:hypothetical protein
VTRLQASFCAKAEGANAAVKAAEQTNDLHGVIAFSSKGSPRADGARIAPYLKSCVEKHFASHQK